MSFVKLTTSKIVYLLPRLILVSIALFSTYLVLFGNFQTFEPLLSPLVGIVKGRPRPISGTVTIGPYPHKSELRRLKQEGYGAVLSLLNTELLPEKMLNELEAKDASQIGLKFYHVSFDYIRLEGAQNKAQVQEVVKILKKVTGEKVYIHCYLGRHRVEFVRRALIEKQAL